MKILSLSGWAQAADALAAVTPEGTVAFDYGPLPSVESFYASLAAEKPEVVIGWSLGGQLALRAIMDGIVSPERLILIAAPFQCRATDEFTHATAAEALADSRAAFLADAEAMLKQFHALCAFGDARQREVLLKLRKNAAVETGANWLFWFDELIRFSFLGADFSRVPETTLIYGEADCIVPIAQGETFHKALPQATLHRLPHCAHAPHLHDAARVSSLLKGI